MIVRAALALAVAGCGLEMSAPQPWIPIEQIEGPLAPELVAPSTTSKRAATPTDPLRVVTYNVEYGPDPGALADTLDRTEPLLSAGVIAIQEIESYAAEGESRAHQLATRLGLGYVYIPAREVPGGTHGLALLSPFPLVDVARMDLPRAKHDLCQRIAIRATIELPGGSVAHVVDVHLDTKLNTAQRIAQLSPALAEAEDDVIVAGDFNTTWVEFVGGTIPVLSAADATDQGPAVDDYMRGLGFATPTQNSGPTEHMLGFEMRLDAIYTRDLGDRYGGVEHVGPSDHWPLWIDASLQ